MRGCLTRVGEYYRRVSLACGNAPVSGEKPILLFRRHQSEAMTLIETDRPLRRGPCTDQQRAIGLVRKELQQRAAYASALMCRSHVCVANQSDVANVLDAHDP